MSDVTTGEMLAWCNAMLIQLASRMDDIRVNGGRIDDIEETEEHIRILGAIRDRLLQARGKAEPPPSYEAGP